ncbi:outer membrane protein assembly factor BamB family protein [Nocardioides sp. T2.26MG-1]|uniref:outer membrane protein assembly factor BamB family protein n=1 Tax=Nocardioides sp. T2.26MG-1 TaxID=3041166 RepID=UPI0024779EBD|nr:PQQ-binding-like beta-propeller repeat protein [Nocardioides sp. T2.26MG-1]CAI9409150.1 hypothetical protein HIDPHFAB_01228 [Nocardioides sp. T2.26MG-1]
MPLQRPARRLSALAVPAGLSVGLALALGPVSSGPVSAGAVEVPVAARAASGPTADDLPAGSVVADERIEELVRVGDRVYAHGWFGIVGRYAGPGAVLDGATGAPAAGPEIADGQVSTVVADGAGGWYLGGDFTRIGGHAAGGLAHVRADGTLDTAFLPVADGLVSALALADGTLYAGGAFESVGGTPRRHLAALATGDGGLRPFDAPQSSQVTELAYAPSAAGRSARLFVAADRLLALDPATGDPVAGFAAAVHAPVRALARGGDRLYLGESGVVALDATTGAADRGFVAPAGPASDRQVHALLYTRDRLYVGGDQAGGRLLALDPATGAADRTFAPDIAAGRNAVDVPAGVYDLALDGDRLWAAGSFTSVAGRPAGGLAVLDAATGAPAGPAVPSYDLQVNAVELSGGRAYVGGHFYLSGAVRTAGIAALDAVTMEPVPGFKVTRPAYGDLIPGDGVLFVANTHFMGYDPSKRAAATHHFYETESWPVRAFDADTGAALPGRSMQVPDLTGITTIGNRLYVARRLQDDVRFPRNQVDVYGSSHRVVASYRLPLRGYVTELASVGGDLIVAGSFKKQPVSDTAMIRVDARTGRLRGWFNPKIEGPVYDVATAGSSLYAAGIFTRVYSGRDTYSPGLALLDGRSHERSTFAPAAFTGKRVLLRVSPLGSLVWVDGSSRRFLDAATGAEVADPTGGWGDRLWSITGSTDTGLAFTSWIEPNLGGRDVYRLGFVAPAG